MVKHQMEAPTGSERALPAGSSLWTLSKPCRGEEQLPLVIPPSPHLAQRHLDLPPDSPGILALLYRGSGGGQRC